MSYFAVVTASNPVLYWTLQETGSGGPLWVCTDYGRYGYLSGTVTSSMRSTATVNLTGTIPLTASTYAPRAIYTGFSNGYPPWGSPAGQNSSGALAIRTNYAGPRTGPFTGSALVNPELTGVFNLSSSWTVEWWQADYANNGGPSIGFYGSSGTMSVGWRFGWWQGIYYTTFDLWWISGSTTVGSPPAFSGSRRWANYNSTGPWPFPWALGPGGTVYGQMFHFILIWKGMGTLSGATNNAPNFDFYINGGLQSHPTNPTWTGTEPPTGSQLYWTNSVFGIGLNNASETDYYSRDTHFCHVSVYDRAFTGEDIADRYLQFQSFVFSGSASGTIGSGSFNIASGSNMHTTIQLPLRNLVAPTTSSGGSGRDPRASKMNPGIN